MNIWHIKQYHGNYQYKMYYISVVEVEYTSVVVSI